VQHDVEPTAGARRREGVLLGAYALLFVLGVWTVVLSELDTQEPKSRDTQTVLLPTKKSSPASK
jgi:hypothetical protein